MIELSTLPCRLNHSTRDDNKIIDHIFASSYSWQYRGRKVMRENEEMDEKE